jgi:hypothetical protein
MWRLSALDGNDSAIMAPRERAVHPARVRRRCRLRTMLAYRHRGSCDEVDAALVQEQTPSGSRAPGCPGRTSGHHRRTHRARADVPKLAMLRSVQSGSTELTRLCSLRRRLSRGRCFGSGSCDRPLAASSRVVEASARVAETRALSSAEPLCASGRCVRRAAVCVGPLCAEVGGPRQRSGNVGGRHAQPPRNPLLSVVCAARAPS